jgi:predicted CXXCH cytochrome family protein
LNRLIRCTLPILLVLAIPLLAAAAELADSPCYTCHQKQKASFAVGTIHEPVASGDCESCHQDHGTDNKLLLTDEVPTLCYGCHDQASKTTKHSPVDEGSCLDCHQVHNSEGSGLLVKAVPDLCSDCHDAMGSKKSVHQPVAEGGCLDCHQAHESDEAKLLSKATPDLCSDCHSDPDRSAGKAPHEPVSGGECSECHQAHESDFKPLLTANYSQERYLLYNADAYSLCFNCHDKGAFEDPTAATDTGFRNGGTNLHYLHLVKEEVNKYGMKKRKEGLTCMGCHVSHGTEQQKLIRINLECGATYCYTMNFRKFEGGGSCVVGCPKPKVYKSSALNSATPIAPVQESTQPLAQQAPVPGTGTTP